MSNCLVKSMGLVFAWNAFWNGNEKCLRSKTFSAINFLNKTFAQMTFPGLSGRLIHQGVLAKFCYPQHIDMGGLSMGNAYISIRMYIWLAITQAKELSCWDGTKLRLSYTKVYGIWQHPHLNNKKPLTWCDPSISK